MTRRWKSAGAQGAVSVRGSRKRNSPVTLGKQRPNRSGQGHRRRPRQRGGFRGNEGLAQGRKGEMFYSRNFKGVRELRSFWIKK